MTKWPMRIVISGFIASFGLLASSCTVDNAFPDQAGLFYCESDTDCEPGYECNLTESYCEIPPPVGEQKCEDEDEDGYGVGEVRLKCRNAEEDTDDTDAAIYPGAPDLCDNKDNDSDMTTADGQLSCTTLSDCPQSDAPEKTLFKCNNNTCVLKPLNSGKEGCDIELPCSSGMYPAVPEECK